MKNPKSEKEGSLSLIKPMIISLTSGMAAIFLLFILFALLMSAQSIPFSVVHTLIIAAGAIGGFIAGFIFGKQTRRHGMLLGALCGILLCVNVLIVSVISFGFDIQAYSLIKLVAIIAASAIGGVMGVNK
ncbi:MAG: TIGR04086 family membrane protein [Oscillospiraceae bacterium]|nr:TIGR04086 family membrane protein [Oscillospiraceae bacterium]